MKKMCVAILGILTLAFLMPTASVSSISGNDNIWALIISGYMELQADTDLLYEVLNENYHFTDVVYLHPNWETKECLDKATVRWAIRDMLGYCSDSDDLIFIFIFTHGGGAHQWNDTLTMFEKDVKWEFGGDEGEEFSEAEVIYGKYDYYYRVPRIYCDCGACYPIDYQYCPNCARETTFGVDFNGNGIIENNVYVGVDECLGIQTDYDTREYEQYWDDEFAQDLDTLDCGKLVLLIEACKAINSTESEGCFSGGFIRDLSAPNRIIITSSNETSPSWADPIDNVPLPISMHSYFARPFIYALGNESSHADIDGNGLTSIGEAWEYAWENDEARTGVWLEGAFGSGMWVTETPWIDDDGDGIPNYSDGAIANETFFLDKLALRDINNDGVIDIEDIVIMALAFGSTPEDPGWRDRCD